MEDNLQADNPKHKSSVRLRLGSRLLENAYALDDTLLLRVVGRHDETLKKP